MLFSVYWLAFSSNTLWFLQWLIGEEMPQQQGLKPIELEGSSKIFIRFSYLMAWIIFDGHWWWLIPRTILIGYSMNSFHRRIYWVVVIGLLIIHDKLLSLNKRQWVNSFIFYAEENQTQEGCLYAKKTMLLEAIAGYVTISPIWCYQQWEES